LHLTSPRRNGYNSRMKCIALALCPVAICSTVTAGEKKAPQASAEDDSVAITATIVSTEQVRQIFGSDFNNNYTVLDVTVSPKGGKPYDVRLDDFILRSESSLDHSGPLAAGQIAGTGELVVQRTYGNRANVDSQRPIEGTKVQVKDDAKADPAFEILKKRIMVEKSTTEPESGLLFFPLSKEKPKHLVLSYKTPASRLRMTFKLGLEMQKGRGQLEAASPEFVKSPRPSNSGTVACSWGRTVCCHRSRQRHKRRRCRCQPPQRYRHQRSRPC
jgi:hypothetical protein